MIRPSRKPSKLQLISLVIIITTSLLWLLSTQIQFFCGYSLLLLRGNLIYFWSYMNYSKRFAARFCQSKQLFSARIYITKFWFHWIIASDFESLVIDIIVNELILFQLWRTHSRGHLRFRGPSFYCPIWKRIMGNLV